MYKHKFLARFISTMAGFIFVVGSLGASVASANGIHYENGYQTSNDSYHLAESVVTEHGLTHTAFNPYAGATYIQYRLNQPSLVTVEILAPGETVRTLVNNEWKRGNNSLHSVRWNGHNNSRRVIADGKYKYRITLANGNQYYGDIAIAKSSATQSFHTNNHFPKVNQAPNYFPTGNTPQANVSIYGEKAVPSAFDPNQQETKISYFLSENSRVSVNIFDESHVTNLINNKYQSEGKHALYWNGQDSNGHFVDDGIYTVEIKAIKGSSYAVERVYVEVIDESPYRHRKHIHKRSARIYNVKAKDKTFNPYKEKTKISYKTSDYGLVDISIWDGGNVVKVIERNDNQTKGTHSRLWDGKNQFGKFVSEGKYKYVIEFTNKHGDTAYEEGFVFVDYEGYSHYYSPGNKFKIEHNHHGPVSHHNPVQVLANADTYNYDYYDFTKHNGGHCGGFADVQKASKYCDAIEFAKTNGIFSGYEDGRFYPNKAIQRDEAVKVVMQAFAIEEMPVAAGEYIGFWDLNADAWYMPYIKAAKTLAIVHGYPDGSFKPSQPMNRVEFTKIFLETARAKQGIYIEKCEDKPYADVSNGAWFKDYVCYAKDHSLIKTIDAFHYQPGKLITRGEAAEFVYNYYKSLGEVETNSYDEMDSIEKDDGHKHEHEDEYTFELL